MRPSVTVPVVQELLEAIAGIGIYVLLLGLLVWALYFALGPQILGIPAMIGVLVVVAGVKPFSNQGLAGVAFMVLGLAGLVVVIGMAMTFGTKRPSPPEDQLPPDRS